MPFTETGIFERPHSYQLHRARKVAPSPEHFDREADDVAQGLTDLRALIDASAADITKRMLALEQRPQAAAPVVVQQPGSVDRSQDIADLKQAVAVLTQGLERVTAQIAGIDLAPISNRLAVVEARPDLMPAVRSIEDRIAGLEDNSLPAIAQTPVAPVASPASWRDAAAAIDHDPTEELAERIADLERRHDAMADAVSRMGAAPQQEQAPPSNPSRADAIAAVVKAARERLLDIASGHVLYELALLAGTKEANAVAASLLKILDDDTAGVAEAIIRHREGMPGDPTGSEWEQTVRIVAARDRAVDEIRKADDGAAASIMTAALAEIEGV